MITFIENSDFGTLAVCALRYCMGRQTYMPDYVRSIIRPNIKNIPNKDLMVMLNDCEHQECFGDDEIDKPGWIAWKEEIKAEKNRRQMHNGNKEIS